MKDRQTVQEANNVTHEREEFWRVFKNCNIDNKRKCRVPILLNVAVNKYQRMSYMNIFYTLTRSVYITLITIQSPAHYKDSLILQLRWTTTRRWSQGGCARAMQILYCKSCAEIKHNFIIIKQLDSLYFYSKISPWYRIIS